MAGPELTSTLQIVDKSSKALIAIEKAALDTSNQLDRLIERMDKINGTNLAASLGNSLDDASDALSEFYEELNRITSQDYEVNIRTNAGGNNPVGDAVEDAVEEAANSSGVRNAIKKVGEVLGTITGAITKPFNILKEVGFKLTGAVEFVSMVIDKVVNTMRAVDVSTAQSARFGQLASKKEGLSGAEASARAEQMRQYSYQKAMELGVNAVSFNEQLMGFANNAAFKSFEEAASFATTLNKSFIAAGTGAQEADSAVRQLLQGLSKGRLQGEDLMSILSAAPQVGGLLEKAVARLDGKALDAYTGKVRDLASTGRLTADVIKDAFFGATADIDKDFNAMPQTFEAAMTRLKNAGLEAFQPLLSALAEFANSEDFKKLMSTVADGFGLIATAASAASSAITPVVNGTISAFNKLADIGSTIFSASAKRNGKYSMKPPPETIQHLTTIEKYIQQVAAETGRVGDSISAQSKSLAEIAAKNNEERRQKTFDEYYNEKVTAALDNARIRKAEESAKKAAGDNWEAMSGDKQLEEIKRFYDLTGDLGVYTGAQFHDLNKEIEDDTVRLEATRRIVAANADEHERLTTKIAAARYALQQIELMAPLTSRQRTEAEMAKKNAERMLSNAEKRMRALEAEMSNTNEQTITDLEDKLYDKQVAQAAAQEEIARYGKEIAKNTREVKIDKESILFMKSMTTAEIINRYNNISDSIAINNNFANATGPQRAFGITAKQLEGALNASRSR